MHKDDFHNKPFDESTQEKLVLFREYLQEWLPVFIQSGNVDAIQIFDFFAGPGKDADGKDGSPLIILDVVKSALPPRYTDCLTPVRIYLNELHKEKHENLTSIVDTQRSQLPSHVTVEVERLPFADAFHKKHPSMQRQKANLLFLDQCGVSEIPKAIFQQIASLPCTDFIFFISSSTINRFKNDPAVRRSVPVTDEDCRVMNGTNVHRVLAQAYQRWLPPKVGKYYIAPFSLKKGTNVYGLIFGSGHPRGMDKFLRVAWDHGGDANFDIDGDEIDPSNPWLFGEMNKPTKLRLFENELEQVILKRELLTNRAVFEFALERGMLGKHARTKLGQMVKEGKLPDQKFTVSYEAWAKPETPILLGRGDC